MLEPIAVISLEALNDTEILVELSNGRSFVLPIEEIVQARTSEYARRAAARSFEPEVWMERGKQALRRCRPAKGVILAVLSGVLSLCDVPIDDIGW